MAVFSAESSGKYSPWCQKTPSSSPKDLLLSETCRYERISATSGILPSLQRNFSPLAAELQGNVQRNLLPGYSR
jgi:hypothetical protein